MSTNVFGNVVTDITVRLLHPTLPEITARHRAEVAIEYMNAGGRAHAVSEFVHTVRRAVRANTATLCMIYNATGNNLTLFWRHSWGGDVARQFYPFLIQNGQWIGFVHTNRPSGPQVGIGGSSEAIVYEGLDNDGQGRHWIQCWQTTPSNSQNRVYTEIRPTGSWGQVNWNNIFNTMGRQTNYHSTTTWGCSSNVTIGTGASPEFVGIMTLGGLRTNFMAMVSDISKIIPSLDSKYDEDDDAEGDATPAAAAE